MVADVFGLENYQQATSPALSQQMVGIGVSAVEEPGLGMSCALGECEMDHEIVSVTDEGGDSVDRYE